MCGLIEALIGLGKNDWRKKPRCLSNDHGSGTVLWGLALDVRKIEERLAHDHSSERRLVELPAHIKVNVAQWYAATAACLAREGQGTAAAERAARAALYLEYVGGPTSAASEDSEAALVLSRSRGEAALRAHLITALVNLRGGHPAPALHALDAVRAELDALPVSAEAVAAEEAWLTLLGWVEGIARGVALRQVGDYARSAEVLAAVSAGIGEEEEAAEEEGGSVIPADPLSLLEDVLSMKEGLTRWAVVGSLAGMVASEAATTAAAATGYAAAEAATAAKMFA